MRKGLVAGIFGLSLSCVVTVTPVDDGTTPCINGE
jgi:hypothetical protein